jgi:pimeloyl-ACP methyl ester carboxylesterase
MPEPPSAAVDLFVTRLSLIVSSFGKPFKAPAEEVLSTRDDALAAPGFLDALDFGLDYTFEEPAELSAVPITVAWGRRDVLLPFWTQARRARRMLPQAQHIALAGCGHIPFYDDPNLCSDLLRAATVD